jgi:hypothetical protein
MSWTAVLSQDVTATAQSSAAIDPNFLMISVMVE